MLGCRADDIIAIHVLMNFIFHTHTHYVKHVVSTTKVKLGLHLPTEKTMKEIVRAAGQHGFAQVDEPGTAFGVLKLFKEKLRYAVRKAARHSPHIIQYMAPPQMKWYEEGDGPCMVPKCLNYHADIPLRKTNANSGGASSGSRGDTGGAGGPQHGLTCVASLLHCSS